MPELCLCFKDLFKLFTHKKTQTLEGSSQPQFQPRRRASSNCDSHHQPWEISFITLLPPLPEEAESWLMPIPFRFPMLMPSPFLVFLFPTLYAHICANLEINSFRRTMDRCSNLFGFLGNLSKAPGVGTAALVLAACRPGLLGSGLGLHLSLAVASQAPGEH